MGRRGKPGRGNLATIELRTEHMKTTAFALIAVSALGLAACQGGNKGTNAANSAAATNAAVESVNSAEAATASQLDADRANTLNQIGTNGASNATGNAAINAAANTAADAE